MIDYKTGDLLAEDAEALVNTVNCVGIMGRGVALQFKRAWPENFKVYAAACHRHEVRPGRMLVFDQGHLIGIVSPNDVNRAVQLAALRGERARGPAA